MRARTSAVLDPAGAEKLIFEHLVCLPIESLPVEQCAGAVLRENVYAERDQPPFDRVSMDGIALRASAVSAKRRRFRIQGTQAAGDAPMALQSDEYCIEIMTGAMLPAGCDAVVPVEQLQVSDGFAELAADTATAANRNVHKRGSDRAQGALLLTSGIALHAPEIAVAASAGMARLRVSAQPAIVVISTGNELIEPGEPIAPHQIRRSNSYAVAAALREHGFRRVADDHLPDDAARLRERLDFHLRTHEAIILSGGVSMGRFDLVPQVLRELGVDCVFHGIAQRPGKPMWFGTTTRGNAVFALPGNPVSTLVCLARYVMPALYVAMGMNVPPPERLALSEAVDWEPGLAGFLPVTVVIDEWGRPWANPRPTNGSGDYSSLVSTSGFVELPPGPANLKKGFVTRLYRW
jgi:molybdopterin molybdotransferase